MADSHLVEHGRVEFFPPQAKLLDPGSVELRKGEVGGRRHRIDRIADGSGHDRDGAGVEHPTRHVAQVFLHSHVPDPDDVTDGDSRELVGLVEDGELEK